MKCVVCSNLLLISLPIAEIESSGLRINLRIGSYGRLEEKQHRRSLKHQLAVYISWGVTEVRKDISYRLESILSIHKV